MTLDTEATRRIAAFTKYARFIGDTFGVTVELDGVRAETDGRVITLPALETLSATELEFLYAVLLHEVGHIRYSDFTPAFFERMPSRAFAHMHNAIEDARVERRLMRDFDGARAIFGRLYGEFAGDRQLMRRIFGARARSADLWSGIGTYAHGVLLGLPDQIPLKGLIGIKPAAAVNAWVQQHEVEERLQSARLESAEDAYAVTTVLYDLFHADQSDRSATLPFKAQHKAVDRNVTNLLKTIPAQVEATEALIEQLGRTARDLRRRLKEQEAASAPERTAAEREMARLERAESALQRLTDARGEVAAADARKAEAEAAIADADARLVALEAGAQERQAARTAAVEEQRNKAEAKRAELESRLETTTNERRRESIERQLRALQERLDAAIARTEGRGAKGQDAQEKRRERARADRRAGEQALAEAIRDREVSEKALARAGRSAGGDLTPEGVKARTAEIIAARSAQAERLQRLEERSAGLRSEMERNEQALDEAHDQLERSVMAGLMAAEAVCASVGMPGAVLPPFEPDPSWPEADGVQQEFDRTATKQGGTWVANGVGLGHGSRNLMVYLEETGEKLQALDLGELFARQIRTSKLDSFNEGTERGAVEAATGETQGRSSGSYRAVTTEFDVVRSLTGTGSDPVVQGIRTRHAAVRAEMRAAARRRFRFGQRDRFKGNQEEGELDARSAWKLASRVDDSYFEVNRPVPVNKVAASIAIDISGSQDKPVTEQGARLREVAVLLSDALQEVHIRHEVLGYHAPVSPEMRSMGPSHGYARRANRLETLVYRKFGDRQSDALGQIELQCSDNADGESLRIAIGRLKRAPARRRLLMVLTDGRPYLSEGDVALLDRDLRDALQEAARERIEVFAFGFVDGPEAFYGDRYCRIGTYADLVRFLDTRM